jgi:CRISPR-associated protein Cmr1
MTRFEYIVRFLTPAFLGDAQHKAEWRVPPFKALLRQWWRVVHVPSVQYDVKQLHHDEARLFGGTAGEKEEKSSQKKKQQEEQPTIGRSKVIVQLDQWGEGTMVDWQASFAEVSHPEVNKMKGIIDANLYLGYGPLSANRNWKDGSPLQRTVFAHTPGGYNPKKVTEPDRKPRSAISPETETARLTLRFPDEFASELQNTVQLIQWFGTIGSRSCNGWGSLELTPMTGTPELLAVEQLESNTPLLLSVSRPLTDCLQQEWQHAIGTDNNQLLVWRTDLFDNWQAVTKTLAQVKIAFRTVVPIGGPQFQERHLLGYPVTNHFVSAWGKEGRLANQIRFKVVRGADTHYRGIILHIPCKLPAGMKSKIGKRFQPNAKAQATVWRKVHAELDKCSSRLP